MISLADDNTKLLRLPGEHDLLQRFLSTLDRLLHLKSVHVDRRRVRFEVMRYDSPISRREPLQD